MGGLVTSTLLTLLVIPPSASPRLDVYALGGGFDAWPQAGLPLEASHSTSVAPS